MKNIICVVLFICSLCCFILGGYVKESYAEEKVEIQSKSAVVMEGSTGKVIYDKDKDLKVNPASITKIMTLLLIYENLEAGKLKLTDKVSVSEHASSMGGSQVYLEVGEIQTVETLIKCISIASANDAAVAMAEKIAGSEEAFVERMNKRAHELEMKNTNFKNCCGLDTEDHYSTAYDVAIMSKELISRFPQITKYTTTWMDKFTHFTKKGEKEFGLTNTNKLVRTYEGITGLKTGSTTLAKYCLSATAKRNDIDMIAVVMSAPEHKLRYSEAAKLLDYGFGKVKKYQHKVKEKEIGNIRVINGTEKYINGVVEDSFKYVKTQDDKDNIIYKVKVKNLIAPIKKNENIGTVEYYMDSQIVGKIDILAKKSISKVTYVDCIYNLLKWVFMTKY